MHLWLLLACGSGVISRPDDTDAADTDPAADTDDADTDVPEDTDTGDPGGPDTDAGAPDVECDDVLLGGAITCYSLGYSGQLRRIDLGTGAVEDVFETGIAASNQVTGLFLHDGWFYASGTGWTSRFPEAGGPTETATGSWHALGVWDGRFVASNPDVGILTTYTDWADLSAGLPSEEYGLTFTGTRMAIHGDEAWFAWHATDYLPRYDLATLTRSGTAPLEGYDTWVWGIARHGDLLLVLNDGRDDPPIAGHEPFEARVAVFDTDGNALCSSWLDLPYQQGLWCEP